MKLSQNTLNLKTNLYPVILFLIIASIFLGIWRYIQEAEDDLNKVRSSVMAEQVAIRLSEYIDFRLSEVENMIFLWTHGGIEDFSVFRKRALEIQKRLPGLLAINWINKEGIITWLVPEDLNTKAKGKDLKKHKTAGSTFLKAMDTGTPQVTPPIDLLQGGKGIAAYFPIRIEGKDYGYLNAVFRLTPVINDCLAQSLRERFDYIVSYQSKHVIASISKKDSKNSNIYSNKRSFLLGGRTWEIWLSPKKPKTSSMINYILVLGLLLDLGTALLARNVLKRELQLQVSEDRYRNIFENAQVGLFRVKRNGRIVTANQTMGRIFGFDTPEQYISSYNMWEHWVDSEFRSRLETLITKHNEINNYEARFYTGKKEIIWVKFSAKIHKEEKYIEGVAQDISNEKQTLQALRESESKYRTIFETTGTATISFDKNGIITLANSKFSQISGYEKKELEGKLKWWDMFSKESAEKLKSFHNQKDKQPQSTPSILEAQLHPKEKQMRDGIITVNLVPGTTQRVASFLDLTARKQAEEQMFRAEKMASLGQIIAGVAHEINNPNNFIYFNLPILKQYLEELKQLLDERLDNKQEIEILNMPYDVFMEDLFKIIENMQHGSERITGIVSDLKGYIRSDDIQEHKPEQISLVIEHVMTLVGQQVRKMVRELNVHVDKSLPRVFMNPAKIEQVLINLLINAGQAADKKESKVSLSTRINYDADTVEVIVEDNGTGILKEHISHIFDPFFTTKGRESGTGLGLGIAQRIMEEHRGSITVESQVGIGSKFTVSLPVYYEEKV